MMIEPAGAPPRPARHVPIGKIVKDGTGTWGYMSGQLGICPKKRALVSDDPGLQTERAIKNTQAIAKANGFTMNDCVKTLVFLTSMDDFAAVNKVYAQYFPGDDVPARSCITVK